MNTIRISAGYYQYKHEGVAFNVVKREDNLWYWIIKESNAVYDLYLTKSIALKAAKEYISEFRMKQITG